MKIAPLGSQLLGSSFNIGGHDLGLCQALFIVSVAEVENITNNAQLVWDQLMRVAGPFEGHIRFDMVPRLGSVHESCWNGQLAYSASMEIDRIYEINCSAPNCISVVAGMEMAGLLGRRPSAATRLLQVMSQEFDGQQVIFVPSKNDGLKLPVTDFLLQRGICEGLNLFRMTPSQVVREINGSRPIIWRWGDARGTGHKEYSPKFQSWLKSYPGCVINTVGVDPGDKGLLVSDGKARWNQLVGKSFVLTDKTMSRAIAEKNELVLKDRIAGSGNAVWFGIDTPAEEWSMLLQGHVDVALASEACWLPRVDLGLSGEFAFDIDPAFWADRDGELHYLYSVVRIDRWARYWRQKKINVSQGAGFAGTVIEQ